MFLVIDIGNTYQKAAIYSEEGEMKTLIHRLNLTKEDMDELLQAYPVRAALFSSVREDSLGLHAWLSTRISTLKLTAHMALPIRLQYATPDTLGSDRIANAVGAHKLFPNQDVLSIQAGSCLVTDLVTRNGLYLGGTIAPGLRMRFQALAHFTAKLPLLEPQNIDFVTGDSTHRSILSGIINGMSCEIDELINRYRKQYSELRVVMTGGDASYLESLLKNSIFAAPNLVLLGLYEILHLHAPK